jgi:uncharacterized membrane protein YdjX (TVP38/TMEM64 family)
MKPRTLIAATVLAAVIIVGFVLLRNVLRLEALAQHEGRLRELQVQQPGFTYGLAFLVYVAVTGLSLPGAAVLTLAYGWLFGVLRGVVLVSFASTAGATLAFLVSRYLFRDAVANRFGARLQRFNDALAQFGPYFLFTLRLIPAVPFFVINLVMGLTPIGSWTFWWVSQLGMLPGTIAFVFAGASVPSIEMLANDGIGAVFTARQLFQLAIAFGLLGLFPLTVRAAMSYFGLATPLQSNEPLSDDSAA